jgi:hypothetical protein
VGKTRALFNKKSSFDEDGFLPRESKKVQKMELFDKARTYSRFLKQPHVESAWGFRVLKGVECPPTHSLCEPRSMASLNLQIFPKHFSQIYTLFTTTFRNLA